MYRPLTLSLALLITGVAQPALAWDLTAQAGATYTRATYAPDLAESQTLPHFDLDLKLDAKGFYERRGLLDWRLGVGFRRITDGANGATTSERNLLTYNIGAVLNADGRSPVLASVFASRSEQRFTSGGPGVYGDGITNVAGVTTVARLPNQQSMSLGYSWLDRTDAIPGLAQHDSTTHILTGRLAFGQADFDLAADYRGTLSTGTWDSDKVDQHEAALTARGRLTDEFLLNVQDNWTLIRPDEAVPGLFRLERNDFTAVALNGRPNGERQAVSYVVLHSNLQVAPGNSTQADRQSLRWEGDYRLDGRDSPAIEPETDRRLFLRTRVDGSFNRVTTPLRTGDSYGETVGAEAYWYRHDPTHLLELRGGPLVALAQPDGASQQFGYGARAGVRYVRPLAAHSASVTYSLDFGSKLYGSDQWVLQNDVLASLAGPLVDGLRYSLYARANGSRSRSPTVGDGASRTFELRAGTQHRIFQTEATASFADGMAQTGAQSFAADGLLIPAPYDAHTRDFSVRVSWLPYAGVRFNATARSVVSDRVGQPSLGQTEVFGSFDYSFGGLVAGVEDRITWYDQNGGGKNNVLMFRIYRSLGFQL